MERTAHCCIVDRSPFLFLLRPTNKRKTYVKPGKCSMFVPSMAISFLLRSHHAKGSEMVIAIQGCPNEILYIIFGMVVHGRGSGHRGTKKLIDKTRLRWHGIILWYIDGRQFAFPSTPDLSKAVRAQVVHQPRSTTSRARSNILFILQPLVRAPHSFS